MDDVAFIGFGEAGQAFAGATRGQASMRAYDKLTNDPHTRDYKLSDYRRAQVNAAPDLASALDGAGLILSLVTADQALTVAVEAARLIPACSLFCDMNSVAPATKRAAATTIEAAGAAYVDVAIMSPVNPARLSVPLLLSGPHAALASEMLRRVGFTNVHVVGAKVGDASAIKMIRSVIVKGIEALTAEAMLAAHQAGVTQEVLASLDGSEKRTSWNERADYNLDRMLVHGRRRAEEMGEVVRTLEGLGIEPVMTRGTVRRQRELGSIGHGEAPAGLEAKMARIIGRKADAA